MVPKVLFGTSFIIRKNKGEISYGNQNASAWL